MRATVLAVLASASHHSSGAQNLNAPVSPVRPATATPNFDMPFVPAQARVLRRLRRSHHGGVLSRRIPILTF
eukprot:3293590-Pyramimonas_sp.AAC.1